LFNHKMCKVGGYRMGKYHFLSQLWIIGENMDYLSQLWTFRA
jgi:hypothetical protein